MTSSGDPAALPDPSAEHAAGTMRARVASRIAAVIAARARVVAPEGGAIDDEAVHDYRVGLRRLRSDLRILRCMWGKDVLRPLEDELKALADATGDVRDEEVLAETLGRLSLSEQATTALATWRRGRSRRLSGARGVAARRLAGPDLGGRLKQTLHAIEVALATPPRKGTTLHRLAERRACAILADVTGRAKTASRDDPDAMHKLRIRIKRLRYAIELLFEGRGPDAALKITAKLQKRLGELHDLDEAKSRVARSWGLDKHVRHEIGERLSHHRHKVANKAKRDLDDALPELEERIAGLVAALADDRG